MPRETSMRFRLGSFLEYILLVELTSLVLKVCQVLLEYCPKARIISSNSSALTVGKLLWRVLEPLESACLPLY